MWLSFVTVNSTLTAIYYLHRTLLIIHHCILTIWLAISFWPKFYWEMFGPNSRGPSIWHVISTAHVPPPQLQQDVYLERHKLSVLPEKYQVHTNTVQVSGANTYLQQSGSQDLARAVNAATKYEPATDPLYLSIAYNRILKMRPDIPEDDTFLHILSFISISMIYTIFITRGLVRLFIGRINDRLWPPAERPRRRRRRRKTKLKRPVSLPKMTMRAFATSKSPSEVFTNDSDGIAFIMDNSATGAICNERTMFIGRFTPTRVTLITAEGTKQHTKMVGTIRVIFTTDEGTSNTYDVPGVVYDQDSPHNLIGIPFLAKYFASTHESHDDGTWIKSGACESTLTWDHGKHERTFEHPASELPEMRVNEGTNYFSAFCTRIQRVFNDKAHYAFSSAFTIEPETSPDTVHKITQDEEIEWCDPTPIDHGPKKKVRSAASTKTSK